MHDYLIKNASIVDGTGAAPRKGSIAIAEGRIAAVGKVDGRAKETIDADGAYATPGWVDVHTHFDGQVSWDDELNPSFSHGVTSIVMGNCGVGFAPCPPGGEGRLVELMEGVEDIPGTALHEGIEWGNWETFPEYIDYLAGRLPFCSRVKVHLRPLARATSAKSSTSCSVVHFSGPAMSPTTPAGTA